jgi:septal ring factor EnvC (AmiA/AmiB activator)
MKRNVLILSIILFVIFVFPVVAQNVEYVDIEETNNEIDEKKAENQELTQTVIDLRKENEQQTKAINKETKWVYRISEVISSMETLLKSMHNMAENTNNEEYKAKMEGMIDENENKLDTIRERRTRLNESIKNRESRIEENNEQIRSTNEKIAKNENRILYLEVAVNRTQEMEDKLASYSKSIDTMIEMLDAEIGEIEEMESRKQVDEEEPVDEEIE